jgi:hypothetical protein
VMAWVEVEWRIKALQQKVSLRAGRFARGCTTKQPLTPAGWNIQS